MNSTESEILQRIGNSGVIAVLVIDRAEDAVPLARALLAGGIDVMELTFRTFAAVEALRQIKANVPEMLAGVGTVLTTDQVKAAVDAGAAFGVAPGLNPNVLAQAKKENLPFYPGIATPSEIEKALEFGCTTLKFFPAQAIGGLAYLKSMAAPYAHRNIRYIPLGGINAENMKEYLRDPLILAVGGSWITKRKLIQNQDWKTITQNAKQTSEIVKQIKQEAKDE